MFLKKLGISMKQLAILGLVTLVFMVVLGLFIGFLSSSNSESPTDLDFLGYQFTVGANEVTIKTPLDDQMILEINDETIHELEILSANINDAYTKWTGAIRNAMIFIYMVILFIILLKQKETYFQGKFKGFLLGASLLLMIMILGGFFEMRSLLISFSHHLSHMSF